MRSEIWRKPCAAEAEIHEGGLNGRLDVGDAALVDVTDVGGGTGPLHVEFLEPPIFQQCNSTFLPLGDVNK